MNSTASSWQPVTSGVTIEVDSGIILFSIFVNDPDELMECIFCKYAGEDGVCGNMPGDSKT